jgi:cell division protein FtsB
MPKTVSATRKQRQILKSIIPYIFGILFIAGTLLYLWMYSEIDETLQETEYLVSMENELKDDINILKDDIEYLTRVDVITNRAKRDLGMVFTAPETIEIYIDEESLIAN